MAGDASVLAEHMGRRDDVGIGGNDPFHFAIPFAGILAVRSDKFFHGEMFVCIVPVHEGCRVEVSTDRIRVLPQEGIPKCLNINAYRPSVVKK